MAAAANTQHDEIFMRILLEMTLKLTSIAGLGISCAQKPKRQEK